MSERVRVTLTFVVDDLVDESCDPEFPRALNAFEAAARALWPNMRQCTIEPGGRGRFVYLRPAKMVPMRADSEVGRSVRVKVERKPKRSAR